VLHRFVEAAAVLRLDLNVADSKLLQLGRRELHLEPLRYGTCLKDRLQIRALFWLARVVR
jgi:hypothetical protein